MIRCLIPKNCQLELAVEMKREFKRDNFWEIKLSSSVFLYRVVPETMAWFPTTMLVAIVTFRSSLRWLKTVYSTFQDVDFGGSLVSLFINGYYNHGVKKLPNHW